MKYIAVFAIALMLQASVSADDKIEEQVVGQWVQVLKNPKYKNSVASRYMRHSFLFDGSLYVENKEDSHQEKSWEVEGDLIVVNSSHKKSAFIEHYKLTSANELEKIRFKSIIDGKPLADYDPKEKYVRQGSDSLNGMNTVDIFQAASRALDFVDPQTLKIGTSYELSKKTPLMPVAELTGSLADGISKMELLAAGVSLKILDRKEVNSTIWYQAESSGISGWVNSIALFGQDLKEK